MANNQKQNAGLWNRFRAEQGNPGVGVQDLYRHDAMNTLGRSTPEMYDSMSPEGRAFTRDDLLQRAALNANDEEAKFKLIQGMSKAGRKQYYANMPPMNETDIGFSIKAIYDAKNKGLIKSDMSSKEVESILHREGIAPYGFKVNSGILQEAFNPFTQDLPIGNNLMPEDFR